MHVWCPAVRLPCVNTWINRETVDPDTLSTTAAPTTEATTTKATTPPPKPKVQESSADVSHAIYDPVAGYDLYCLDQHGKPYRDGMGCVLIPWTDYKNQHGGMSRTCLVGKCLNGRCTVDGFYECATS
ncbi:hypothetical protein MTO96_042082 [Rhipicephalus appendiculatus]